MGRQSDQNSSLCTMMLGLLKARVIVLVSDWVAFVHGGGGDYWFLFWQCTHFSKLDCEFEPMYRECAHACDVGGYVLSGPVCCIAFVEGFVAIHLPIFSDGKFVGCTSRFALMILFVVFCFVCGRSDVLQFVLFRGKVLS